MFSVIFIHRIYIYIYVYIYVFMFSNCLPPDCQDQDNHMAHMSLYPISCIYNYVIQLCFYLISHPILYLIFFIHWIGLRETPQIFHGKHGKHVVFIQNPFGTHCHLRRLGDRRQERCASNCRFFRNVLCASGTPQGRHLRADSLHVAFFF